MRVAGKRVHVVGSSSVGENGTGSLGQALQPGLQALGASAVTFDGSSGRGLAGRAQNRLVGTPEQLQAFKARLAAVKSDVVLLILGGNPSGSDIELQQGLREVRDAVAATGAHLLWMGPPTYGPPNTDAAKVTAQYERLAPPVLGRKYQSSQPYTDPTAGRTLDGVHFTAAGAKRWALGILDELHVAGPHPVRWLVAGAAALASAAAIWRWRRA